MPVYDYIPATDEGFATWAAQFAMNISANPALYMLTPAQAVSIQSAVDNYVAALAVVSNELTRTKPNIVAKDDARSIAENLCRQYAMIIKELPGVSDEDKVAIGVRPINPNRDPVNVPQTSPIVTVIGNTPGAQTLQYRDPTEPDSRARPFGAASLQLFMAVTPDENAPLVEAKFVGLFTRNPMAVEFNQADSGKAATYYARWCDRRGEVGPWSLPVSMRIAA